MTILDVDRATTFASSRAGAAPRGSLATLRLMLGALRDSLFAYRRYEHLRSKGTPHRAAIKRALGATSSGDA
jgi:hypothetical protein